MKNFNNKIVVITGAASGIGKALSQQFANQGAKLILIDFDKKSLVVVEQQLQAHILKTYCFDVSKNESVVRLAKEINDEFGGADVVINNAGVALGKMTLEETSIENFEWLMNINFWGMVYGSKAFLPQLKTKKQSVLVNVSSLFGLIGVKYQTPYCSSKYAIRGFTESLMAENLNESIQIHLVHPGGIDTNITKNTRGGDPETSQIFHEKFLTRNSPEKAAITIVNGIKSNKKRIKIGSEAHVGDLASRIFPISLVNFVQKHFLKELD